MAGEDRTPETQTAEAGARSLLDGFAATTGVTGGAEPRRYLWTDAFAVCTWLGLGEVERALALIDQVHRVLGRHRPDDEREGWISGLPEEEGWRHPTAGGLRIGKPLPERGPDDPYDRQLEWERDGQYFHYLTKWIHALGRTAAVTGEPRYHRWAAELGTVAYDRFGHGPTGTPTRLYWKMSIDLARPVVPSMGQHDALDGYVVLSELRDGHGESESVSGDGLDSSLATSLDGAIDGLARMTEATSLATDDPLGVGSLLADGWLLARVTEPGQLERQRILDRVLEAGEGSLAAIRQSRLTELPATQRLAFRELGLALGIEAITRLAAESRRDDGMPGVAQRAESMAGAGHLGSAIRKFWLDPENRSAPTWADHEDINTVMLAASLAPDGYLGNPSGSPAQRRA